MNNLKIILAASIAAALTLSCSRNTEDDLLGNGSSSSVENSSSSVENESSSSKALSGGGKSSSDFGSSSSVGNSSSSVENESSSSNETQSSSGNSSVGNESSSSNGTQSGGNIITEVYTLKSKTADQFTYIEVYEDEDCEDGGELKIYEEIEENTVDYSINNNILTWKYIRKNDTLNFKGTSNELIDTWTRTKNKDASCVIDDYWGDYYCKKGYDITKAAFTETNVSITRDICITDQFELGEKNGWKDRVVDCNTGETYKGSDIVTVKITGIKNVEFTYSYNGKSCKYSKPSKSQKQAACREAWDKYHLTVEYWDIYYYDILEKDFDDCIKGILPAELLEDDEDDSYGTVAAKPAAKVAKSKIKPMWLLKKKK